MTAAAAKADKRRARIIRDLIAQGMRPYYDWLYWE